MKNFNDKKSLIYMNNIKYNQIVIKQVPKKAHLKILLKTEKIFSKMI